MIKKQFFLIIFSIFLTILLSELLSYFYIESFTSPYTKAKRLLKKNESFSWIQKSNLETTFFNENFFTNKNGFREKDLESFDILILGPSSTVGWGVDQISTYPAILDSLSSKKVFNAGQIGYSIEQGYKIYKHFFQNKKFDTLILAYGINDLDFFPFEVLKESPLSFLNTSFLLQNKIYDYKQMHPCPREYKIAHRVSYDRYTEYLNLFYKEAQTKNFKLILLNTAQNYQGFDDPSKSNLSKQAYKAYLEHLKNNNCELAREEFFKAQKLEAYRIVSDVRELNSRIKSFSDQKEVALIDLDNFLSLKKDFFVDPVHFSVKGNKKIATEIKKQLQE